MSLTQTGGIRLMVALSGPVCGFVDMLHSPPGIRAKDVRALVWRKENAALEEYLRRTPPQERVPLEKLFNCASDARNADACAILVKAGYSGRTWNAFTASRTVAPLLLAAGASVNETDESGLTGLMQLILSTDGWCTCCSSESRSECGVPVEIKCLLELGADVNAHDDNGHNALSCAISMGRLSTILLLVQMGAVPSIHALGAGGGALVGWQPRPTAPRFASCTIDRLMQHYSRDVDRPLVWLLWVSKRMGTPLPRDVARVCIRPHLEQAFLESIDPDDMAYNDPDYLRKHKLWFTVPTAPDMVSRRYAKLFLYVLAVVWVCGFCATIIQDLF